MTDKLSPFWLALLLAFVLKAFFVVFGTPVVPFLVGILLGCCALGTAVHFGINVLESLVKEHIVKLLNAKAEKPESKPSFVCTTLENLRHFSSFSAVMQTLHFLFRFAAAH